MKRSDAAATETLSVQLRVTERRCVVVGGGPVAARRARTLLDAGARVCVVAPDIDHEVESIAHDHRMGQRLELRRRAFVASDVDGAALVVAACGGRCGDAVSAAADERGVLVNRADDATAGTVEFPAVIRRGPVRVAVSSAGRAPAVTRLLAGRLDEGLDDVLGLDVPALDVLVQVVEEVRSELAAAEGPTMPPGPTRTAAARASVTPEGSDWRSALDGTIIGLITEGRVAEAKERLKACLSSS